MKKGRLPGSREEKRDRISHRLAIVLGLALALVTLALVFVYFVF